MTIVMTPERKPFFAATYLPRQSQFGRMGLIELCQRVTALWAHEKEKILASAEMITDNLAQTFIFSATDNLDKSVLDRAYDQLEKSYDARQGGFDAAPKFPTPHRLLFLIRYYHRKEKKQALDMVKQTLKFMRLGGIWDHVGFGFHRYSTDSQWLLPHFEKMLYDQALISLACLEAFQITRDPFFSGIADEIFTYVLRDMTSKSGAFFSAEDADSEGQEGKFYIWDLKEFRQILGPEEADLWEKIFNLSPDGNFTEEATGQKTGTNILNLSSSLNSWAEELNIEAGALMLRWEEARKKLYHARKQRIHPLKDDKILTDWNGLMIAALALGAVILGKSEYTAAAERAAQFILEKMRDNKNRLLHRFREGESAVLAHADDYAFLAWGLLNLYRATFNPSILKDVIELQNQMLRDYWDNGEGGFFLTAAGEKELPVRPKELYDGAVPSANSVSLFNLIRLSRLTGDVKWEQKAAELSRVFSGTLKKNLSAYTFFLLALDLVWGDHREIVVTGEPEALKTREMLALLNNIYSPHWAVLLKSKETGKALGETAGFTTGLEPVNGQPAAYVCTNFSCHQPVTDARALNDLINTQEDLRIL